MSSLKCLCRSSPHHFSWGDQLDISVQRNSQLCTHLVLQRGCSHASIMLDEWNHATYLLILWDGLLGISWSHFYTLVLKLPHPLSRGLQERFPGWQPGTSNSSEDKISCVQDGFPGCLLVLQVMQKKKEKKEKKRRKCLRVDFWKAKSTFSNTEDFLDWLYLISHWCTTPLLC